MTKQCTLPALTEMLERAKIEHTHHVCPVHRIHIVKNYKLIDSEYAPTMLMPEDRQAEIP